jgi:GNAT superfamily N-acetyltransferase
MARSEIRRATPADANNISACIDAAYQPVLARGIKLPAVSEGVSDDVRQNLVWVIETEAGIVAGLIAAKTKDGLHIANLFVDPAAQGQGHAVALMQQAERVAGRLSSRQMHLATHRDMPENVAFYTRLGWQVVARDQDKIMMSKIATASNEVG